MKVLRLIPGLLDALPGQRITHTAVFSTVTNRTLVLHDAPSQAGVRRIRLPSCRSTAVMRGRQDLCISRFFSGPWLLSRGVFRRLLFGKALTLSMTPRSRAVLFLASSLTKLPDEASFLFVAPRSLHALEQEAKGITTNT